MPQPQGKAAARPPGDHVTVRDIHEGETRLDLALPLVVRERQAEDSDLIRAGFFGPGNAPTTREPKNKRIREEKNEVRGLMTYWRLACFVVGCPV